MPGGGGHQLGGDVELYAQVGSPRHPYQEGVGALVDVGSDPGQRAGPQVAAGQVVRLEDCHGQVRGVDGQPVGGTQARDAGSAAPRPATGGQLTGDLTGDRWSTDRWSHSDQVVN